MEIKDPYEAYERQEFLLPEGASGDAIEEGWALVHAEVMEVVQLRLRHQWKTVCVWLLGTRRDKADPTIVISSGRNSKADWSQVFLEIKSRLDAHALTGWKVEFDIGTVEPSAVVELIPEVRNGNSIGIVGHGATGTIGGFVTLHDERISKQARHFALTSHHVVNASDRKRDNSSSPLLLQPYGSANPASTQTVSPSVADLSETLKAKTDRYDALSKSLGQFARKKEAQDGVLQPSDAMAVRNWEAAMEETQSVLDQIAERRVPIGQTIATSGFRTNSSGRTMDWALVEVYPPHQFASVNVFWHQDREFAKEHRRTERSRPIRGETLQATAKLDPGDWVCLKGRTSGLTTGIVHRIRLEVNDWTAREGELVSHEILAIHTGNKNLPFGKSGDSGAWRLNASG